MSETIQAAWSQLKRDLHLLLLLFASVAACGSENAPPAARQMEAVSSSGSPTSVPSAAASWSISEAMAITLVGLIEDTYVDPSENVVDRYARVWHWDRTSAEVSKLAKVAYVAELKGHKVTVGSDGTNDIIAISTDSEFDRNAALVELRQAYNLLDQGQPDDEGGMRTEAYLISEHGIRRGLILVTYGEVPSTEGVGTLVYMSKTKMNVGHRTLHGGR